MLHRLVDAGNSVVMIEHNLDLMAEADWIIDMGPEAGDRGGRIVAGGTPAQIAARRARSHTGAALARSCALAPTQLERAVRHGRTDLVCWKCGADSGRARPCRCRAATSARSAGPSCTSAACASTTTRSVAKHCREPTAEEVSDKTSANFCDFFKPRPMRIDRPNTAGSSSARAELERLFGKR